MSNVPGCSYNTCDLNFINRNGGTLLLRAGYQYTKKRINKGTVVWKCVKYHKNIKCSVLLTVKQNTTIVKETIHKCTPDVAKNEVDIKLDSLRKAFVNSKDHVHF